MASHFYPFLPAQSHTFSHFKTSFTTTFHPSTEVRMTLDTMHFQHLPIKKSNKKKNSLKPNNSNIAPEKIHGSGEPKDYFTFPFLLGAQKKRPKFSVANLRRGCSHPTPRKTPLQGGGSHKRSRFEVNLEVSPQLVGRVGVLEVSSRNTGGLIRILINHGLWVG